MSTIRVINLSYRISCGDLRNFFGRYGEITNVHIPLHPVTGHHRRLGYVDFKYRIDAEYIAKLLDGYELDRKKIRLVLQRTKPRRGLKSRAKRLRAHGKVRMTQLPMTAQDEDAKEPVRHHSDTLNNILERTLNNDFNPIIVKSENLASEESHDRSDLISQTVIKEEERDPQSQTFIHILSRHTPYPDTFVKRYPVPDEYVPWERMWANYDPVTFTRPKWDFPIAIKPYVDEDELLLQAMPDSDTSQLPGFQWNCLCLNPAGISIDRTSWIRGRNETNMVYKLGSDGIPRNIYGRTGLKGRGFLPRWGPNHYVFIIITRLQRGGSGFQFVAMRGEERGQFSLPGGFVPGERKYDVVRLLFKSKDLVESPWNAQEDMLKFFKSSSQTMLEDEEFPSEVKCTMIKKGYMDDPWNSDQAWMEVELWHVHFQGDESLSWDFRPILSWRLITEDILKKIPSGQAVLLQEVKQKLQSTEFSKCI